MNLSNMRLCGTGPFFIIVLLLGAQQLPVSAVEMASPGSAVSRFEAKEAVIATNRLSISIWHSLSNSLFGDDVVVRVQIENIGRRGEWIYMPGLSLTLIRAFGETNIVDGSGLPERIMRDDRGGVGRNWVLLRPGDSYSRTIKEFPTREGNFVVRCQYSNKKRNADGGGDTWLGETGEIIVRIPLRTDSNAALRAVQVLKNSADATRRASTALAVGESANGVQAITQLNETMRLDKDLWVRVQALRALQRITGMQQSPLPEIKPPLGEGEQHPDRVIKQQRESLAKWLDERIPGVEEKLRGRR